MTSSRDARSVVRGRLREVLDDSGLDWEAERGSKHVKIRVAGRLAGVVSMRGNRNKGDVGDSFVVARVKSVISAVRGDRQS